MKQTGKGKKQQGCKETDRDGGKKRKAACEQEDDTEGAGEQKVHKAETEGKERARSNRAVRRRTVMEARTGRQLERSRLTPREPESRRCPRQREWRSAPQWLCISKAVAPGLSELMERNAVGFQNQWLLGCLSSWSATLSAQGERPGSPWSPTRAAASKQRCLWHIQYHLGCHLLSTVAISDASTCSLHFTAISIPISGHSSMQVAITSNIVSLGCTCPCLRL
jgi:hypothetical protein